MRRRILTVISSWRIVVPLAILAFVLLSWFSGYLPTVIVMMYEAMTPVRAPERPDTVPAAAIWAGGRDGGVFIDCIDALDTNVCFDCFVYFDYTGNIRMRDVFCINEGTIALDSLRKVYGGFDGVRIFVRDGRHLVPSVNRDTMSSQDYKDWYDEQAESGWDTAFRRH